MKHYLNVCDVNGAEVEPVDVITFGSPCQDLSVAGKRAGLKHESNGDEETTRSGLFMEAVRIIKEMRNKDEELRSGRSNEHIRPRFAVWENVPGAFSSNKGEDFRVVLEELARIKDAEVSIPMPEKGKWKQSGEIVGDGWSIAWRTLDAQYHGVPQRRRRIFLVADFADECAGEILFECKGLPGYPSQSREKGQGTSRDSSDSIGESGERECIGFDGYNQSVTGNVSKAITSAATDSDHVPLVLQEEPIYCVDEGGGKSACNITENVSPTLTCTHRGEPVICDSVPYTMQIRSGCEGGGKGPLIQTDKSACLTAAQTQTLFQPVCIQGSMIGRKDENGPQGDGINVDKSFTLNTIDRHAVAYGICSYASVCEPISIENHPNDSRIGIRKDGTVQSLTGRMGTGGGNVPLVAEPWTYQKVTGPLMAKMSAGYCGQDAYNDMFVTEPCYSIKDEGFMDFSEEVAATLKQRDYKMPQAVCYAIDRASFNQGENAQYDFQISDDGIAQTLIAKGPGAVSYYENIKYIVRRLTPTECARLQGMPDLWCRLSQIDDMSDEDYEFWKQAHKTYAEINGKTYREKTKKQMISWYNKLQIDGSEYKAYGNGMALPCVRIPINGIAKHGAKTMASLFDGIGGFPLAGLIDGIKTLWTSEIELFPIAVTIERFREYEKYGCFTFGYEP